MTFKPAMWYPIAVVLSVINLVGVGFAAEPWHATIHAGLALAFGLWAQRLRKGPGGSEPQARLEALEAEVSKFEALEAQVSKLRQGGGGGAGRAGLSPTRAGAGAANNPHTPRPKPTAPAPA